VKGGIEPCPPRPISLAPRIAIISITAASTS
jgi:hypothetical protein